MKILKYTVLCLLFIAGTKPMLKAQNYTDLLRYSEKFYQSTARAAGAGNAFGALGSDPVSMSINPAGIGIYRKSEFTIGAAITRPRSTASYLGVESTDDKYNLNIGNFGIVLANIRERDGKPLTKGWVGVNWGFGLNRTNSFHRRVFMEAKNTKNSILEDWAAQANGQEEEQLFAEQFGLGGLARQAFLIQRDTMAGSSLRYIGKHQLEKRPFAVAQQDEIATRGAMNDINIAVSGNYSNKFYIGAALTLPTIGYHSVRTFKEQRITDSLEEYKSAKLEENINTSGIGVSGSVGAIYRASDYLRLGLSVALPGFYSLKDNYDYAITSEVRNTNGGFSITSIGSPIGEYSYSIVTPWRATASAAYIVTKNGFISADYEYVDYTDSRINSDFEGARNTNIIVQNYFKPGGNLRLGTEWKYEAFAFRAGFGYYGSPYKSGLTPTSANASTNVYSLGIGYRESDAYLDLSYQLQVGKYYHLPYSIPTKDVEGATVTDKRTNILLTLGLRF